MAIKTEATQVKIKGLKVVDFFDDEFIGMIEKRFPNLKFQHFCMNIIDEEENIVEERFTIAHNSLNDEKIQDMVVDSDNPNSLNKLIKVIDDFVTKRGLK